MQVSISGPVLFSSYMSTLRDTIRECKFEFHSYADDMQLYISVSPDDYSPHDSIVQCFYDINVWMSSKFLQLKQDKTNILIFEAKARSNCLFTFTN